MSWLDDTYLRDLEDDTVIEATCLKCGRTWRQSALQLRLKVQHGNVTLAEVQTHLACNISHCAHVGVRLTIIRAHGNSSFVGGLP